MSGQPITGSDDIRRFYDDPRVVDSYLKKRIAEPFGSVLHGLQVAFMQRVMTQLGVARVLDLAPGPARLSAELPPPPLAVAMDASRNILGAARRRMAAIGNSWQLAQGDAYQLPFTTASFDLVYSLRFVRRFDRSRRDALYAEIRRVLAPGGFFVMDAQNRVVSLPHRMVRGLEKYPVYDELFLREEIITELEENGFRVVEIEGLMRRFAIQFRLNRLRHLRLGSFARLLIQALEHTNDRNPSTWMVLCQKRKA